MTPEEKATAIGAAHGTRIAELIRRAAELACAPFALEDKVRWMFGITDELAGYVIPYTPCRSGCSHCCYQAVAVSEGEALRIKKFIGSPPAEVEDVVISLDAPAQMQAKWKGIPCTFLDIEHGKCTIYEARPMACRTNFNLSDDPTICDIFGSPGATVPNINFSALWMAQASLSFVHDMKYADIREFYPKEIADAFKRGLVQ